MKVRNCYGKCHRYYIKKSIYAHFNNKGKDKNKKKQDLKKCGPCHFSTETKDTRCICCNTVFRTRNTYRFTKAKNNVKRITTTTEDDIPNGAIIAPFTH